MAPYLLAIVTSGGNGFSVFDQRFKGMSWSAPTHPLAPSLPREDAGKWGKKGQKTEEKCLNREWAGWRSSQKSEVRRGKWAPARKHSPPGTLSPARRRGKEGEERQGAGREREKNV